MKFARLICPFAMLALCLPLSAENWPQWRGPAFNGSSPEKDLPTNWSKESALWSVEMPGLSASTPIIWDDLVFISTVDAASSSLRAICLDRISGKILWNKTIAEGSTAKDERSNYTSPSPVADATRCFFFYGNGTLVAFDHKGVQLWSRSITKDYGDFAFNWTFSSSPTLYDGKLFMQVLQRNVPVRGHGKTGGPIDSFLLVLDPATGTTLAQVVRPTDALLEAHEAYSTPIPFEFQGKKEILVSGGNYITGHDIETGRELWRSPNLNPRRINNWRLVTSPVPSGDIILFCAPQQGSPVCAIKVDPATPEPQPAFAWRDDQHREVSADVPTPLLFDNDFFVLNDGRKSLARVDPATGTVKWSVSLPGTTKYEAAPTGADGKIYVMNFAGAVSILNAADGAVINTVPMGDDGDDSTRSAIAVSHGELFIRTNHKLYCIGKK